MATHKSTEDGHCATTQLLHRTVLPVLTCAKIVLCCSAPGLHARTAAPHGSFSLFHHQVCHAILDRSWTPNTSVSAILGCVYGLLLYPDHDDPLDSTLALQMYDSSGEYEAAIIEHVKTQAR